MSRGPLSFKQGDVMRATKAVLNAGLKVERVEVDPVSKIINVIIAGTLSNAESIAPNRVG